MTINEKILRGIRMLKGVLEVLKVLISEGLSNFNKGMLTHPDPILQFCQYF